MIIFLPGKLTSGTDSASLNSIYAIPLNLLVLLHVISLTSRTLPTDEKNSSRSLARMRCESCMQNTVRKSLSSGGSSSSFDSKPRDLERYSVAGSLSMLFSFRGGPSRLRSRSRLMCSLSLLRSLPSLSRLRLLSLSRSRSRSL